MKSVPGRSIVTVEPDTAGNLKQLMRTDDISLDKGSRPGDRTVDVGFGGKVHDRVDLLLSKQCFDRSLVSDVCFDEAILLVLCNRLEAREVSGIGQGIENHDPVTRGLICPVVYKVCANEAGAAGDK